ncbi:MAG TPA: BTAD domain-containing putative transcriptional regulator [Ktedonobacteraceae bacterium]|nr:BTAD domain-containing putative transcriptional regulator [Ktedonobacteraceae bacterium]
MQVEKDIPASVVVRVYLLGPLEIWKKDPSGTWKLVPKDPWRKSRPARSTLKRLLVQPGRRLSREQLVDDVWPESTTEPDVYNAISLIRGVIGKPLVKLWSSAYEVAGQALVWTDLDAAGALLKEVENRGPQSALAFPLLEQALSLLERGELVEGEEGTWCYAFRKRTEDMLRQTRQWLAEGYETQGKLWQAGEQYRAMVLREPSDEEALKCWLEMLVRHGKRQEALKCFQDMKDFVETQGFPLSPEIEQIIVSLHKPPLLAPISPVQPLEDLMKGEQSRGKLSVHQSRRSLVQGLLGVTGIAFLSGDLYPDVEILERLSRALHASPDLDETTVMHLERITKERRYTFVQSDGSTWREIFQEMSGHLRIVTQLLERHARYPQLCTIAGETALLLGDILFNAGDNNAADKYYQGALEASQGNTVLKAVILSRKALLPIYDNNAQTAISLIDEAQQVVPATAADLVLAWLWAVKGEAYAALGESTACFQALRSAERLLERGREGEISLHFQPDITYATFDLTKLSGYKGACLLRLKRSETAQGVLYNQLTQVQERAFVHQQSIALADLAASFVQQTAIRQAYEHATLALHCIEQTRSMRVFQRILKLRQSLDPWVNTTYVKNLDEHIHVLAHGFMKGTK